MVVPQDFIKEIKKIMKNGQIIQDNSVIRGYFSPWVEFDSNSEPLFPALMISVEETSEIEQIFALAMKYCVKLIPTSSSKIQQRFSNKSIFSSNSVLLDLSKMNKIRRIDRKNRVVVIEPGVTFADLIPELASEGLRIIKPILSEGGKSVLTSCLEREPISIPRYQWDTFDPVLCLETYFGNGKMFRSGSAAGPGDLNDQQSSCQAQTNPMGPAQCNLGSLLQGAMGSLGIITWASLKCELLPSKYNILFVSSSDLNPLLKLMQFCVKNRFGDEILLLNLISLNNILSSVDGIDQNIMEHFKQEFTLLINLSGLDEFAGEKIKYQEKEILNEINKTSSLHRINVRDELKDPLIKALQSYSKSETLPWNHNYCNRCREIFFLSPLSEIERYYQLGYNSIQSHSNSISDFGLYIQPLVQGCNYHIQFDLYFKENTYIHDSKVSNIFKTISLSLMEAGAFFSRSYGPWREIFRFIEPETKIVLGKVKKIFDPENILNPEIIPYKQ